MKKIVITGGHLTPALAVIEELEREKKWQILFIGRKQAAETDKTPSVESEIISEMGIIFIPITTGRVYREISLTALISLFKIPLGFYQSLMALIKFRPNVIVSFGGYLSVPVVFAGWLLGIPIITHEQTTVIGLATKFNAFFACKIAVSWPSILKDFPRKKVVLTGNPIRKEIFKVNSKYFRILDFDPKLPLILVTGGNQGSHVINCAVEENLSKILPKANVFHLCGHLSALGDFERLENKRARLPSNLKEHYHAKKYIYGEEMGTFMNKADLVISRAGINTVTELMSLGKPAILIPYPHLYRDEQLKNAQMMANKGLAQIILEKELTGEKLYRLVVKMLENLPKYKQNALRAQKLVQLNAAQKIVEIIQELVDQN